MIGRMLLSFLVALTASAGIASAAGLQHGGASAAPIRVAFTRDNSLWMTTIGSGGKRLIRQANATSQPSWYQWSPDGKYLLVSMSHPKTASSTLVLYNAKGVLLRTLVPKLRWYGGYYASWAANADRVAFIAGNCKQMKIAGCVHPYDSVLYSVGVHGRQSFAGSFTPVGSGGNSCGGYQPDPTASDPSKELYRVETDFGITMPILHWYAGSKPMFVGLLNYVAPGTATATTARSKTTAPVVPPSNVAVSAGGRAAGVVQDCTSAGCTPNVALFDPATGRVLRTVARGADLPALSPDGATVYFVRRTLQQSLTFTDVNGNPGQTDVYRSEIWRANAGGGRPVKILSEDAYGFGRLSVTPDGAIIFTRIDNSVTLWQHRQPDNQITSQLLQTYGPSVSVQRLNAATGVVRTLIANAGRPAVQP